MRQLHILFLCDEYPTLRPAHGGVGSMTRTLGRALVQRGHRVTVLAQARKGQMLDDAGVRVIALAQSGLRGPGALLDAYRLRAAAATICARDRVDAIDTPEMGLAFFGGAGWPSRIIRMHGGHHFFSDEAGQPTRPARALWERRSFGHADDLVAVSRYVAERTRELLKLGELPIVPLPNSVDTERFAPNPTIDAVPGRIVFVGTIVEKKGIGELIRAMPAIVARHPQAYLIAAGRDRLDPYTKTIFRETIERTMPPHIRERVRFSGPIANDQLPKLLATAAVCVYPSHSEALPMTYLEGMAMGRPVVVSKAGPGPEIICNGESGLLCEPRSPESIADTVLQILCDQTLATRLGATARRRAVEHFSINVLAPRNEEFYRASIERVRRG